MQVQNTFSSAVRDSLLHEMMTGCWDVLVIGGGITGAGIALDAQARGLRTALVEMQDFAAGTSSRSTKLIHGGLRYLKQLEFGLVAEVGRERAIVYENSPHVTKAEPMMLPLVRGGSLNKWSAALGLHVYDWLAGVKKTERCRMLNAGEVSQREPLLRREALVGGALYYEYRTDDARLTIEVLKAAVERGARALNYLKVTAFLYVDEKIAGVRVQDQLTREEYEITAKIIVNATGPWVDLLDGMDKTSSGTKLSITKGVHLVFDHRKFPIRQSLYFDAADGRMVFAIPRGGKTYVGTTDTTYHGDFVNPQMTAKDRDYLLHAIRNMFVDVSLTPADVESHWVGLRPLILQPGKGPTEVSRRDEIFEYPSGLITIAGGKLTGYRKMAERIVDVVSSRLATREKRRFEACSTANLPVSGGQIGGAANFDAFVQEKTQIGEAAGLSKSEAADLAALYGSNVEKVYGRIDPVAASRHGLSPMLLAQLLYSIEEEMSATPSDFFIRRTGSLYFAIDRVRQWQEPVLRFMAHYFHWDTEVAERHRQDLLRHLTAVEQGAE